MMQWLLMGLLTAGALALLIPAFRSARREHGPQTRAARLAVYRDRLRELEGELTAGSLDENRYAEARQELEDAAALDIDDAPAAAPGEPTRQGMVTAGALVVVVGVLAWGLYAHLGTPAPDVAEPEIGSAGQLDELVEHLAARLAERPNDLDGWMLLGRSRTVLGDFGGSVAAWRQAMRIAPDDPTVLANFAEALVLDDPDALQGDAAPLIEQALVEDPDNPKALWYGGVLAEARGDRELAALRWEALLEQDPPPQLREAIVRRIEAVGVVP